MSAMYEIVNDSSLTGKSATEIMSAVSAQLWKSGVDEDAIAEYCLGVRGCADGETALSFTREWVLAR